jgi:ketosteroid isomerase-like protein
MPVTLPTPWILVALSFTLALISSAHAQAPAPAADTAQEAAIEAAIRGLSTEWSQAVIQRDPAIFERIWAPDFVYVEPSGRRYNKAEGIADLKRGTDRHTTATASSIDVRVYGGGTVAVDIGDFREVGRDKEGKPFDRLSRFTNVWVLHDGAWQCVSGHASAVPPHP